MLMPSWNPAGRLVKSSFRIVRFGFQLATGVSRPNLSQLDEANNPHRSRLFLCIGRDAGQPKLKRNPIGYRETGSKECSYDMQLRSKGIWLPFRHAYLQSN